MKILLIHRYFWPDTPPYAVILKKIAARLASDGHQVEVLSTQPTYKPEVNVSKQSSIEIIDGYRIYRFNLVQEYGGSTLIKSFNMFFFGFRVFFHTLLNTRYDVIMISTSPPILAGFVAKLSAKLTGAKFLYHCMDIHPEIGKISGEFSNKFLYGFLQNIDSKACRFATRVIVLSEDMKNSIIGRGDNEKCHIDVIQNFDLNEKIEEGSVVLNDSYIKRKGVFRLIFAGNIGRFQGLDTLVDAFLDFSEEKIELIFLGDGRMKKTLEDKVISSGVKNVHFIPHQPLNVANNIIQTADLGIVSLSPGIYRYAYPTKVIAYLSVGCPIFAMLESESSLVSFIKENKVGVNVDLGDKSALKSTILKLNADRGALSEMRKNAAISYKAYYDEKLVLDKWSALFKAI